MWLDITVCVGAVLITGLITWRIVRASRKWEREDREFFQKMDKVERVSEPVSYYTLPPAERLVKRKTEFPHRLPSASDSGSSDSSSCGSNN
jgi:hypothetical protein